MKVYQQRIGALRAALLRIEDGAGADVAHAALEADDTTASCGSLPPNDTPEGWLDILQTIELGLKRGYTPADLLDENSPIRDRMRAATSGVAGSGEPEQRKE